MRDILGLRYVRPSNLDKVMWQIGDITLVDIFYHIRHSPGGSMPREVGPGVFGEGRSYGSAMVPFERAIVVSYRLSIVSFGRNLPLNVSDVQIYRKWVA